MEFIMRSGRVYDFSDSAPHQDIALIDLLQSIATERRFYNQVPWTVLQHSIAAGLIAMRHYPSNNLLIRHAFCHDLHETFCRDVPRFMKTADMEVYEAMIAEKVHAGIGLDALSMEDEPLLTQIDHHLALVEALEFFPHRLVFNACIDNMTLEGELVDLSLFATAVHVIRDVLEMSILDEDDNVTQVCLDTFRSVLVKH